MEEAQLGKRKGGHTINNAMTGSLQLMFRLAYDSLFSINYTNRCNPLHGEQIIKSYNRNDYNKKV